MMMLLQNRVRDPRAGYEQTLSVLRTAKETGVYTKSSIMLGLGEKDEEIVQAMKDLKAVGVDIFTLGQYLQVMSIRHPRICCCCCCCCCRGHMMCCCAEDCCFLCSSAEGCSMLCVCCSPLLATLTSSSL